MFLIVKQKIYNKTNLFILGRCLLTLAIKLGIIIRENAALKLSVYHGLKAMCADPSA